DRGTPAQVGVAPPNGSLMMIQGPLALDWRCRKWGLFPRLENGDLTARRPPSLDRLALWMQAGVHVVGPNDWLFIKLHAHGAEEASAEMLLGEPMRRFHESLREFASRDSGFRYYYVTTYEMASLVRQAQNGATTPQFERTVMSG